jgi:hypothetical protein
VYSKAKETERGRESNRGEYGRFAPYDEDEHHGNIEFVDTKIASLNVSKQSMIERRLTVREAGV